MVKVQISRDMMTEVENDYGNRQQVEVLSMLTLMKAVMMIMLILMRLTVIMVNLMKKKHT